MNESLEKNYYGDTNKRKVMLRTQKYDRSMIKPKSTILKLGFKYRDN